MTTKEEVINSINILQARIPQDQNQLMRLQGYLQRIEEEEKEAAEDKKPDLKAVEDVKAS
tara:strand:+ start:176 stop:355 length:180 start_codon:yes stop_codon:yes gene_type:complete